MTEVIKKVKGFVNKKGDKFELEPSAHTHDRIQNEDLCAEVECGTVGSTDVGKIKLYVENSEGEGQTAEITASNIGNLKRALQAPDSTPIANSNNPVTSGGVAAALDNKANTLHTHDHISYSENNGVSVGDGSVHIELHNNTLETGGEANITVANLPNLQRALQNPDNVPTAESNKLVTSGGVASALSAIQIDDVQFDVSQLAKGIVYTILFKNQTGEECMLNELINISRLPSSEQNISYNVDPDETRIQNGDPAALRVIRTETETYVLYDGAIFY